MMGYQASHADQLRYQRIARKLRAHGLGWDHVLKVAKEMQMSKQPAAVQQHQGYVVQRLRDLIQEIETGACVLDDFKDEMTATGVSTLRVVTTYKKKKAS